LISSQHDDLFTCENIVDNAVNMANRTAVSHRTQAPPITAAHSQRSAGAMSSSVRAEVMFKGLPFYDVIAEIMKPSSLGPPYCLLPNEN